MNKHTLLAPFRKPSPRALALAELENAQRELLSAQSAKEYAASVEQYNQARIERLTAYLKEVV